MDYVQQSKPFNLTIDGQQHETARRYWVYPRISLKEEELKDYADGLREIIPDKLLELMEAQDELVRDREYKLNVLKKHPELDDFSIEFWCMIIETDFDGYYVIQKWIRYWLNLLVKIGDHKLEEIAGNFTQEQILQARSVPLIDLYNGKLIQAGSRCKGICPFHKEKTASFTIFESENSYYCFGCHDRGNVIDFYMKVNDVDFPQAVRALLLYG